MSRVIYECGCWFEYDTYGEQELMSFQLCDRHIHDPQVLQTRVCDLSQVILADLRQRKPGQIVAMSNEPIDDWAKRAMGDVRR